MSRSRRAKALQKKSRRRWGRTLRRGVLAVGGVLALALVVFLFVMAGQGGDQTEPADVSVAEKGPGGPAPDAQASGPSLYFPVTEIDFGDVPLNTPVSYFFEYVNNGDAPVTIEGADVKVLEGC